MYFKNEPVRDPNITTRLGHMRALDRTDLILAAVLSEVDTQLKLVKHPPIVLGMPKDHLAIAAEWLLNAVEIIDAGRLRHGELMRSRPEKLMKLDRDLRVMLTRTLNAVRGVVTSLCQQESPGRELDRAQVAVYLAAQTTRCLELMRVNVQPWQRLHAQALRRHSGLLLDAARDNEQRANRISAETADIAS